MTYYKNESEANGHTFVVQQVRGPESSHGASEVSAWIDRKAVYLNVLIENPELLPEDFRLDNRMDIDAVERTVAYLVMYDLLVCPKCEDLFAVEHSVRTGFAGVKCGACDKKDKTCSDGGKHDWKCLNPHQKRNARVATKYKCVECGKKRRTTPTG